MKKLKEIKEVAKNFYSINTKPFCSVFIDDYLMKKVNKILYKYSLEIEKILTNNTDHLIKHEWSCFNIKDKQYIFYSSNKIDKYTSYQPGFYTEKIKNIFDIGNEDIYDKKVENEVKKLIKQRDNL